jgi:hypothetical protein
LKIKIVYRSNYDKAFILEVQHQVERLESESRQHVLTDEDDIRKHQEEAAQQV